MTGDDLRGIISTEVRHYVQGGGKINRLAVLTGLAQSTISKLAYGETKHPRMHTVLVMLMHFGYEINAVKVVANHIKVVS